MAHDLLVARVATSTAAARQQVVEAVVAVSRARDGR
jgi:hypothetical protein